jgi:hypothetical protein
LLHPAAGHGVRCVSGSRFPGSAAVLWPEPYHGREDRHRPRSASHTPRRNPRQQPHHVTVAVAPLPFENDPPRPETTHRCQYTAASSARPPRRLRGLAPPSSSDDPRPLPAGDAPCPSMGFAPLQGPSWTPASERGPCRATRPCPSVSMAKHPKTTRQSDTAPFRTVAATSRCRPGPSPLRVTSTGATHPRDPKTATVAAWARHRRRPESRRDARRRRPAVASSRRLTSGVPVPGRSCEHEDWARADTRGGRNPFCGSPGSGGSPILPSLTEARIRGAAAADRSALARRPTVSDEPVPKKSVRS